MLWHRLQFFSIHAPSVDESAKKFAHDAGIDLREAADHSL